MLAALTLLVAVILPWAQIRRAGGVTERLGMVFRGGNVAVICALVLLLAGFRLWRARRRWTAMIFAFLALLAGTAATIVAVYELVVVEGRVLAALSLPAHPSGLSVSTGNGLWVALGGGLLGLAAAWVALRRLRRDARAERISDAIHAAAQRSSLR
jgi:hypothetical protein